MENNLPPCRLFVCMKVRTDGRSCCAHLGAAEVLEKLRQEVAQRGDALVHIDVRPSGCLDLCEQGPVVMAFRGPLAEQPTFDKELLKASLDEAAFTFVNVSPAELPTLVDTVLGERTYTPPQELGDRRRRERDGEHREDRRRRKDGRSRRRERF